MGRLARGQWMDEPTPVLRPRRGHPADWYPLARQGAGGEEQGRVLWAGGELDWAGARLGGLLLAWENLPGGTGDDPYYSGPPAEGRWSEPDRWKRGSDGRSDFEGKAELGMQGGDEVVIKDEFHGNQSAGREESKTRATGTRPFAPRRSLVCRSRAGAWWGRGERQPRAKSCRNIDLEYRL